jgi:transcriptional regulator with XRE-family HTH domain
MSSLAQASSARLRRERVKRKWTLAIAAKRFGTDIATLSHVERGMREPPKALAEKMAEEYGVTRKTIYRWYLETTFQHRRPALIGNTKLRFYPYGRTSDLDERGLSIVEPEPPE